MSRALFSFRMVPVISSMLAMRRIDVAPLVREAGLPDEALHGDVIAPLERVQALLAIVAKRADLPLFGIELAERVPTGAFGLTEFLMRAAPSAEAALLALCEFSPLINPLLEFRFAKQAGAGYLHFAVPGQRDALGAHLNEYTLMLALRQFSGVLGSPLTLSRVWFAHTGRDRSSALAARFNCPVELGAADCGFAVTADSLARRPPTADPALFDFLSAQARTQLANVGSRDIISQVARVIEARLASGALSGTDIARAMATTFRSLQRHLAAAGTTYRDVLQHVRLRRRAELVRTGLTPSEIATRLGFSTVSAMRRSLDE